MNATFKIAVPDTVYAIIDLDTAGATAGAVRDWYYSLGRAAEELTDTDWHGYDTRVVRIEGAVSIGDRVRFGAESVVDATDLSAAL